MMILWKSLCLQLFHILQHFFSRPECLWVQKWISLCSLWLKIFETTKFCGKKFFWQLIADSPNRYRHTRCVRCQTMWITQQGCCGGWGFETTEKKPIFDFGFRGPIKNELWVDERDWKQKATDDKKKQKLTTKEQRQAKHWHIEKKKWLLEPSLTKYWWW